MAQAQATPQARAALPGFLWNGLFCKLHAALWPHDSPVVALGAEPPALLALIKTLRPDDGWLTSSSKGSEPDIMDVDGGGGEGNTNDREDVESDVHDDQATIRYINTQAHPALAILEIDVEAYWRGDNAAFVVRHEYDLFMQHAMSCVSKRVDDSFRARFFVTGQPGIGLSFGCYYFLFRLLASGQSVFFLNSCTNVFYFSSDGVQQAEEVPLPYSPTVEALRKSWVLIDVDDNAQWRCPQIFRHGQCVIWTSSLRESRMNHFMKVFGAEPWFMKAWSTKEIAAVTERFEIQRAAILKRLELFGGIPVPSALTVEDSIKRTLRDNFMPMDAGNTGVHPVFLVQPLVVRDKSSGRARLQRTNYSAEFISAHITQKALDHAQNQSERLQGQLAMALDISTTRSVAGKVVEGLMHRALTHDGMTLPGVFDAATVARTFELIGEPGSFVCETPMADSRPLYLRPQSSTFAVVDAILVTDDKVGFIQTSPGDSHRRDFATMLRIMTRLTQVCARSYDKGVYCIVGPDLQRVQKLVAQASRTLEELKELDDKELAKELAIQRSTLTRTRLFKFRVFGYIFGAKHGFVSLVDAPL
ncbi:hypothetical protein B0H11DRAFT_2273472 [Mycena galericulata]|nr:hypothetical protein B0H11DRAFT_2273472 [Mycena galericulata]